MHIENILIQRDISTKTFILNSESGAKANTRFFYSKNKTKTWLSLSIDMYQTIKA